MHSSLLLLFLGLLFILMGAVHHEDISYEKFEERCKINSKHPDWTPYCGVNFFEKDPQWFIDNGYEEYIKK